MQSQIFRLCALPSAWHPILPKWKAGGGWNGCQFHLVRSIHEVILRVLLRMRSPRTERLVLCRKAGKECRDNSLREGSSYEFRNPHEIEESQVFHFVGWFCPAMVSFYFPSRLFFNNFLYAVPALVGKY